MTIHRMLFVEMLKLRRTLAVWMIAAAPAVVVLLNFLMYHERVAYFARGTEPLWDRYLKNGFVLWSLLMMPLYIALQCALLASVEHASDRWRNLLALPVARLQLYVAKLAIPVTMVAASTAVLQTGLVASALLLRTLKPQLRFPAPIPWVEAGASALLAIATSMFVLAIQQWVSLRFSSFAASAGFGIAATIAGTLLINSQRYGPWFPWTLTAQVLTPKPGAIEHAVWYSLGGALVVSVAGAVEFSRREIRA